MKPAATAASCLIGALVCAVPAAAQTGRAELIRAGVAAYTAPEPQRAIQLLTAGVDPGLGPRDSLWAIGVQTLVEVLLDQGRDSLGLYWARWTLRQAPGLVLDTTNFLPATVDAFRRALASISDPREAHIETTWRWSTSSADARARGSVRAFGGARTPVSLTVVRVGVVNPGDSLALPAGSYQFQATSPGFLPVTVTREILPGIETILTFRLAPEAAGLLSVAAQPWGIVVVDGQRVGYSPVLSLRLAAGNHVVHVQREGYAPVDTTVTLARDATVRLGLSLTRMP